MWNSFHEFHIFAGLIPLSWKQRHYQETHETHENINKWVREISAWFLHQGISLWKLRNEEIHGTNNNTTTMDMLLNQQIQQLYEMQHEVNHQDRQLFTLPLEKIQEKSTTFKKQWVENTRQTIYKCIDDYHKQ